LQNYEKLSIHETSTVGCIQCVKLSQASIDLTTGQVQDGFRTTESAR